MPSRTCIDPYSGPMVKGIDVSHHNGTIDWDAVARSTWRYAIIRTGDLRARTGPEDTQFARNWTEARRVGMRRGSYQYFRGGFSGIEQADLLLSQIARAGGSDERDLPPAIDLEEAGMVYADNSVVPTPRVLDETMAWLERVESGLGVTPIIYTGQWWHWKVSQQGLDAPFGRYPLWTASYGTRCCRMPVSPAGGPAPWSQWTIWQYANDESVPGIHGDVDGNYFRGDDAALDAFVRGSRGGSSLLDNLTPFGAALRRWLGGS